LVIEIDGQYHLENQQLVKDKSRTEDLQHSGYTVIRFTNEEVVANTQEVLRNIKKALMEIIPSDKKKAQNAPKISTARSFFFSETLLNLLILRSISSSFGYMKVKYQFRTPSNKGNIRNAPMKSRLEKIDIANTSCDGLWL
jgi:plastocyanin domain-containing protein